MFLYQKLTVDDVALFKQLLKVFGEVFEDVDTYQKHSPSNRYLQTLLGQPYFIVVVALNGNQVVGGLVAYELQKFEQERRELYIYDLAVIKPFRRKGVATSLINELRSVAKERGVYVIFVQADIEDGPAIRLYELLGVKEEVLHFDIAVL